MLNLEEVIQFVNSQGPKTTVHIGCDSERVSKQKGMVDYNVVVVVHLDGSKGCKIFGETIRERDYETNRKKPGMRLMNEVFKASELYLKLAPEIIEYETFVHLDINPNPTAGSSCVITQAIGYIKGTCQIEPLVKPHAWAASSAADCFKKVVGL